MSLGRTEKKDEGKERNIYEFKIILVGDIAVGKTAILTRYTLNEFTSAYHSTIGVEFKSRDLALSPSATARLKLWDTCGQERYRSMTRQYFRDASGVAVVFDLTSRASLDGVREWVRNVRESAREEPVVFVVGNKFDVEERDYSISSSGKSFALLNDLPYFEVSARTGLNVENLFEKMAYSLVDRASRLEEKEREYKRTEGDIENYKGDRGKVEKRENKVKCC